MNLADRRSVHKGPAVCKMLAMTTFQRARSEEQREVRRRAILDAAAAMLAEMPVAQVTLNELSRRVGLAKSNVLRYFESREAVLLELLDSAWQEWLTGLEADLGAAIDAAAPVAGRGDQLAGVAGRVAGGPARAVRPAQRAGRRAGAECLAAGRRGLQAGRAGRPDQAGPGSSTTTWVSWGSTTAGGSPRARSSWPARCGSTRSHQPPCSRPTSPIPPWPSCGPTSRPPCARCSRC